MLECLRDILGGEEYSKLIERHKTMKTAHNELEEAKKELPDLKEEIPEEIEGEDDEQ